MTLLKINHKVVFNGILTCKIYRISRLAKANRLSFFTQLPKESEHFNGSIFSRNQNPSTKATSVTETIPP